MATPTIAQYLGFGIDPTISGATTGDDFVATKESVGAGNTLVRYFSYARGLTPTVSSSNNTGWTKIDSVDPGAGTNNVITEVWYAPNCNAGNDVIKIHFGTNTQILDGGGIIEIYNVNSSPLNGSVKATNVAAPSLATGSFTPTVDDANNLILSIFACTNSQSSGNPTSFVPGGTNLLLQADISFIGSGGMPKACQYFVKAATGSTNPSITCNGDAGETFNCIAIAFRAGNVGTAPPAGIRAFKIIRYTTNAGSNPKMHCPMDGGGGVITAATDNSTFTSATDSDGTTWQDPTFTQHHMWYIDPSHGGGVSNSKIVTLNGTSVGPITLRYIDIVGIASNALDTIADVEVQNGGTPRTVTSPYNDAPDLTPTVNGKGIVIAIEYAVTGPCIGLASGAPAGAVFDSLTYTGENDVNTMENSDGLAHVYYTTNAAQTWNWAVGAGSIGSGAWGGAIALKAAPIPPAAGAPFGVLGMASNEW